jgi:hypothetical protein
MSDSNGEAALRFEDIVIDREFARLVPPPTQEELERLEAKLLKEGCCDALVLWKGHTILLDGHTRLELCRKRGIRFTVR